MRARYYGLSLGCLICFLLLNDPVTAGPARRRMEREIYPEVEQDNDFNQSQVCVVGDVVYGVEETVPADEPCLKCRCQPPGVQCEATRCPSKKPGCKVVHRPNQCCPDYQCECELNGRKYSNGERLDTMPGDECRVCYCRGGEIQCADVSCYVRNDCEGKQVPGQCCLKYDHCPPRDSLMVMNGSSSTSTLNPSVAPPTPNIPVFNVESIKTQNDNSIQSELNPIQLGNSMQNPKITIQEIIPDVKEIPIISIPPSDNTQETEGMLIIEEAKTTQFLNDEDSNDLVVTDSDAESSEITEVIQNPPPVIRIGDNLLFLKKNELINEKDASSTPASIITLIGAEGLQRGELDDFNDNVTSIDISTTTSTTDKPISSFAFEAISNDLASASSSHILSLVKKRKKPAQQISSTSAPVTISTTEYFVVESSSDNNSADTSTPSAISSESPEIIRAVLSEGAPENITQISGETNTAGVTTTPSSLDSANSPKIEEPTRILELDVEQNPAYPTIPDIISRNTEETWMKIETDKELNSSINTSLKNPTETKILHEVLSMRSNKTVPFNVTHGEWLKIGKSHNNDQDDFTPMINLNAALPLDILNAPEESDQVVTVGGFTGDEEEDEVEETTTIPSTSTTVAKTISITSNSPNISTDIEFISGKINDTKLGNITEWITSSDMLRSVETVESSEEYSGEKTTPKSDKPVPMVSEENASIESDKKDTEANDMLVVKEYTIDLSNDEEKKESFEKKSMEGSSEEPKITDVEMINPDEISKNISDSTENASTKKNITKRENSRDLEDDKVFSELKDELGLGTTQRPKTPEEEEIEARRIFQELLEETSTPKSDKPIEGRTREAEALEKVSQALSKLALRGSQQLDTGVLSVLRDFFSSQYRAYDSKSP